MKNVALAAASAALIFGASAGYAQSTVYTGSQIANPTAYTGFETIGSHDEYSGSSGYTDGGLTITYVGSDDGIWTTLVYNGNYGWYNNGGGNGYTSVRLTDGGLMSAIEFAGSVGDQFTFNYELLNNGTVVGTGSSPLGGNWSTLSILGVSGVTFDEARLQATLTNIYSDTPNVDALAIDDVKVQGAAAVPEPASWAMFIGGFGLIGGAMRRRKTVVRFA